MGEDELQRLRAQAKDDLKLFRRAERALGEIDRAQGLSDDQADVLAALRIRIEGKRRASLDELLSTAGEMSGQRKDIGEVLQRGNTDAGNWPVVEEKKRDWPTL